MKIALLGPAGCGKTVYATALLRAGFTGKRKRDFRARPVTYSNETFDLQRAAVRLLMGESLPATHTVSRYEMMIDLPGSLLWRLGEESFRLVLVDTPGGEGIPPLQESISSEILDLLVNSDGILLMIPSDLEREKSRLVERLRNLFDVVREHKSLVKGEPLFSRIAVVVSKAELLIEEKGAGALFALEEKSPEKVLGAILGSDSIEFLQSLSPLGGCWFSLLSVFGFDRSNGSIAAERDVANWRMKRADELGFSEHWWPYRLFEPLEFLGRGVCWQERNSL